jgi:hypothetical protein
MGIYCSYEHADNGMEPAAMTQDQYLFGGGRDIIASAEAWVWQDADSEAQAIAQHVAKHDEWAADQEAGRAEKAVY